MTKKETKQREYENRRADLLLEIKPGDRLFTILKHVSQSGMMRHIDVIKLVQNNDGELRPYRLTYNVAKLLGYKMTPSGYLKVGGIGMDMGFSVIYSLSRALFPQGFDCIGDKCPSNDHANGEKNTHHKDGGYALRQEWI